MTTVSKVTLKRFPQGLPDPDEDFETVTYSIESLRVSKPNEILLENHVLSVDPYMRSRMRNGIDSYVASFKLGEAITGFCVARVEESNSSDFPVGTFVSGMLPWQTRFLVDMNAASTKYLGITKIPPDLVDYFPLEYFVGGLGMPGMTAWLGLEHICKVKKGETIFVSAASGAVGQLVGQLARLKGARVVGSAGTDEKVAYVKEELKFDSAFNYKKFPHYESLVEELRKHCPNGIDAYFDNVGGETLDAALACCNHGARFAECGMISQYNTSYNDLYGIKNGMRLIAKEVTMQGFIYSSLVAAYGLGDFWSFISKGLKEGEIKYKNDVIDAPINKAPAVFVKMLKGENFGKQSIRIKNKQ